MPYLPTANDTEDREGGGTILTRHLLKARAVLLSEVITDRLSRRVTAQLLALQGEDDRAPITVYINSPGGSVDSGFAIYDMLRFVKPPVRTVITGLCASAAVLIYLAPPKELRFSLPSARYLLHQPSTQVMGDATDIAISAREIVNLRVRYNEIVARETGKTVDQVTKDADRDFWLTAEEAQKYGLVGKIIRSYAEMGL
jgi:ATP-dependent Clp protease protease subunit